jgi:hypothetical protein
LVSSRDLSNTSTKTKLKRAFYLHKAGLALSHEDQDLLFPEKSQNKKDPNLVIFGANGSASIRQWETNPEDKKETIETKKSVDDVSLESTPGSIGSKLLMQFKKLSAEKGVERPSSDDLSSENEEDDYEDEDEDDEGEYSSNSDEDLDEDDHEDEAESEDELEAPLLVPLEGPVYQPIEIKMPIDHQGKILVSDEIAQKSSQLLHDSLSRQEKLKYILDRDPKIQVQFSL